MRTIQVNASRAYEVRIGPGLLSGAGEAVRPFCTGGLCAVVTDDIVDGLYAAALENSLREAGLRRVEAKLYKGDRHEILNERDRKQVYADLKDWILARAKK